jgi:hypothetical protein
MSPINNLKETAAGQCNAAFKPVDRPIQNQALDMAMSSMFTLHYRI